MSSRVELQLFLHIHKHSKNKVQAWTSFSFCTCLVQVISMEAINIYQLEYIYFVKWVPTQKLFLYICSFLWSHTLKKYSMHGKLMELPVNSAKPLSLQVAWEKKKYWVENSHLGLYSVLVTQSCLTLWDPMDYSPPGHLYMGLPRQEWVVIPFSRGSSWPRDWTQVSHIAGRFFMVWDTRLCYIFCLFVLLMAIRFSLAEFLAYLLKFTFYGCRDDYV